MGSVVTGMAMGTGSAIAHRAVDGMMGPRQVEHVHTPAPAAAPAAAPTTGWFGSSAPAAPGRSYADLSSADAQMRLRAVLPALRQQARSINKGARENCHHAFNNSKRARIVTLSSR